jgi:hypothetical protein
MTRYYIAGPMTGIPQFNFPLFHAAAAALRAAGHEIVSPAEQDSPAVQVAAMASTDGALDADGKVAGETWGDILAKDVKLVADGIDGIIFLPDWHLSRGARLEAFVALLSGKHQFGYYVSGCADPIRWTSTESVRQIIRECMP